MTHRVLRFLPRLLFLLGAGAAVACSSASAETSSPPSVDASGPIAARMNDVSILFPLPVSAPDVNNLLSATAVGEQGVLVPSAAYEAMGGIAGTTADAGADLANQLAALSSLRVVAMRIDPCFAALDPDPHGADCTAQIRIVFQQVTWGDVSRFNPDPGPDASVSVYDSALHAFYDLSRGEFLALAQALVALREANGGDGVDAPLGPHPIMTQQGLAGAMSQGVQKLILEYAGEKNLVRLAQHGSQTNGLAPMWLMSAFDVSGTGKVIPSAIATLDGADAGPTFTETLFNGVAFVDGGEVLPEAGAFLADFGPTSTAADDFLPLDEGRLDDLSSTAQEGALSALVRVENPDMNSPNTVDCASCHQATPTESGVGYPVFKFDDTKSPLSFQPDPAFVSATEMTPAFRITDLTPSIHAFSYSGTAPGVSQRTMNETARVVAYLNQLTP